MGVGVGLLVALTLAFSAVGEAAVRKTQARAGGLDYLVIEVNGQSRLIRNGGELIVVKGDKIKTLNAVLVSGQSADTIVLPGLLRPFWKAGKHGRSPVIDTAQDLKVRGEGKGENAYSMTVFSGRLQVGTALLKLDDPVFRYALCQVNGKDLVIRGGELTRLKKSDKFRLKEVSTNLDDIADEVKFEIKAVGTIKEIPGVEFFEIQFSRVGQIFGRVPLQLEGS